jgi:glyoxylate/hydroxypyruvate/2-ketogluconate reductase
MKPAVLVARAVFPEILERLRAHFEVQSNDDDVVWSRDELAERLRGKAGLFSTGGERIDAAVLDANPQLRVVSNMAVGYNNIDVPACTVRGVLATNAPGVLTETTADLGFALMMAAARRMAEGERFLRSGQWTKWSYDLLVGSDVHGATLGILGMGRIGQAIARRGALGFGMQVIYHNRSRLAPEEEAPLGARYVDKATLLREADHLVLVLPYTPESHHAIGSRRAGADEAERHADQRRARRHRRRRGAGRGAARAAHRRRRASTCSRASRWCCRRCSSCPTWC